MIDILCRAVTIVTIALTILMRLKSIQKTSKPQGYSLIDHR